jgi:penicillin-binding protein 2
MLIVDEIKKNDPHLRLVALMFAFGFCVLIAGLWWVQVVSARKYQSHLETQAYRSVRIPSLRGKIFDREGRVLAENRPRYNLSLYLGDLRRQFDAAYDQLHKAAIQNQKQTIAAREKELGRSLTKAERKQFALTGDQLEQLRQQARQLVAGGAVAQVGRELGQPIAFDPVKFERQYRTRLALPYTVINNASPALLARYEEGSAAIPGVDVELQSIRDYPLGGTTAHLLGYVLRDDNSKEGEEAYFDYYLPDYRGVTGVEGSFDSLLRGQAGGGSVLVNSVGYRQSENILDAPEAGHNLVLTIDLDLQNAAAASFTAHQGEDARGAVVVMDVRTGDVLALVSSPAYDPDYYVGGLSAAEFQAETAFLSNTNLRPQINRATYENYAPGSIFKTVVAIAALEHGLDTNEIYHVQANPERPGRGIFYLGKRAIRDTAPPGDYNFQRAFIHSSNSYFITNGLRAGAENILRIGEKFHLGERTGLLPHQETGGHFPTQERVESSNWRAGDTANLCIGQGEIAVTPVQIAVMVSAIANGGKVLWPRIVERIEPQDPASGEAATNFPAGLVRDNLDVHPRTLSILRQAMLADVQSSEGTGIAAAVNGMQICAKTGTAEVQDAHNRDISQNFWFASFAPYENPKYAVVVMVEGGLHGSGGLDCAPIAHDIYAAILAKEKKATPQTVAKQ